MGINIFKATKWTSFLQTIIQVVFVFLEKDVLFWYVILYILDY